MLDLSSSDKKELLSLARKAIEYYLEQGEELAYEAEEAVVCESRACFVTLHHVGKLRGCIGTFEANEALYKNILRMSVHAAFKDPRFSPLTKKELEQTSIEISVLGPLEKVLSIDEIEVGKHGVYVKHGERSGTFLPQVATEQGWSAVEFVTFCAKEKAGLSIDECQKAELYRYEVEKFSDSR